MIASLVHSVPPDRSGSEQNKKGHAINTAIKVGLPESERLVSFPHVATAIPWDVFHVEYTNQPVKLGRA